MVANYRPFVAWLRTINSAQAGPRGFEKGHSSVHNQPGIWGFQG